MVRPVNFERALLKFSADGQQLRRLLACVT